MSILNNLISKYLFSSSTSSQCQKMSNLASFAFGQLKLSDTSFFLLKNQPPYPYSLHFYKITFASTAPDMALTMACPSGQCSTYYSESLLVSSSIYSFFAYGSSFRYLYLAVISLNDGSVSSRYKSSVGCDSVYGAGYSGDYIIASVWSNNLLIFNKATNTFIMKVFTGNLYGIGYEITTGR